MSAIHSRHSLGRDTEETFRPSAPFRRGIAKFGFDVAFCFQTIERGINGADRYVAVNATFNLLPHRYSIGPITKTQKRQDYDVLEFSEIIPAGH